MRRVPLIIILLAVAATGTFVVLHFQKAAKHPPAPVPVSGPVFLSVFGFTTNSDLEPNKDYFSARIHMTNSGTKSVFYLGDGGPELPGYDSRRRESSGWRSVGGGFFCSLVVTECELKPSQSITFDAFIFEGDKPCQVTLEYWDDKGTRRFAHTAATEVFQFLSTRP